MTRGFGVCLLRRWRGGASWEVVETRDSRRCVVCDGYRVSVAGSAGLLSALEHCAPLSCDLEPRRNLREDRGPLTRYGARLIRPRPRPIRVRCRGSQRTRRSSHCRCCQRGFRRRGEDTGTRGLRIGGHFGFADSCRGGGSERLRQRRRRGCCRV